MVMLDFINSLQTSSAHVDDPKKKKNRVTERETKYLYEKTELETITSLFVSIATILKPQA